MNQFDSNTVIQFIGEIVDLLGVAFIIVGIIAASIHALRQMKKHTDGHFIYRIYRQGLARSILIGLEFLVAGDLIRSVAGNITLEGVVALAIIVAIRLVLGMSLEMEIDGRWPWQHARANHRR